MHHAVDPPDGTFKKILLFFKLVNSSRKNRKTFNSQQESSYFFDLFDEHVN